MIASQMSSNEMWMKCRWDFWCVFAHWNTKSIETDREIERERNCGQRSNKIEIKRRERTMPHTKYNPKKAPLESTTRKKILYLFGYGTKCQYGKITIVVLDYFYRSSCTHYECKLCAFYFPFSLHSGFLAFRSLFVYLWKIYTHRAR